MTITYDEFTKVDIRVGTITAVKDFPEARNPAYKLIIDFGNEIGSKQSSAQITALYTADNLIGKQIMAVVNFPPKQIGPFMSEVLVLGFYDNNDDISLATPDHAVPNGHRLH